MAEKKTIKLPDDGQVYGVVEEEHGGCRMTVKCSDGETRLCKIPGSLQRDMWVEEGDLVIVEPRKLQGDKKGDIVHRYTENQAKWLKENGYFD